MPKVGKKPKEEETLTAQELRLKLLFKRAMKDACKIGFGFIVFHATRNNSVNIYHASWLEVQKALNELGVIGPYKND